MPAGWVHATVDLISFGRTYFHQHKKKDEPWKELGRKHRVVNHQYYNLFGKLWNFQEPFPSHVKEVVAAVDDPNIAEQMQSWNSHDYLDRLWDGWSERERRKFEKFCMYLVRRPKTLRDWAGVDVKKGKIKRIIDGQEMWEDSPDVIAEWKTLKRYVKAVKRNQKAKTSWFYD